jgi:outer membrane protein assembly factor BamB
MIAIDGRSGQRVWTRNIGSGSPIWAAGETIFATTGFGEVLALAVGSGEILWRKSFGAPIRAAPAAKNGLVVAVTRDNRAVALDGSSGAVRWRQQGTSSDAASLGGASPVIVGPIAVLPYASGELVAVDIASGRRLWSAVLSGGRRGLARSAITDVSGDPRTRAAG